VPLSGGFGLRILCSSHRRDFAGADRRAFVPLTSSVSIRRNPLVTRAQAAVARLGGVQSATVQRVQNRLDVSLRVTARPSPRLSRAPPWPR